MSMFDMINTMADEEWKRQRLEKYRDHDLPLSDVSDLDILTIRGNAVHGYKTTVESDNVRLIIDAFMGYLTSRGYRIVNCNGSWMRELDEDLNPINVLYDSRGNVVKKEKV